jgi:hypothetical protein
MDALMRRWCEAEGAFDGDAGGSGAAPGDLQANEEDDGVDEAVDRTAHRKNGRLKADREEPHRNGEHVSGGDFGAQLPEDDGDLCQRDGEVGEDDGGDLVAAAAEAAGAELHRFGNNVADAESDVADVKTGGNGEGGVAGEADDGCDGAEEEGAGEGAGLACRSAFTRGSGAACAGGLAAHAVVLADQRGAAEVTALEGGLRRVFGGGELRCVGHAVAHGTRFAGG